MNCKPGDLAVFVGPGSRSGKIFRVLKAVSEPPVVKGADGRKYRLTAPDLWEVDPPTVATLINSGVSTAEPVPYAADEYLRPIRDTDGEDETLTWAGKPKKETV